jgi:hypothetical protein
MVGNFLIGLAEEFFVAGSITAENNYLLLTNC